MPEWFTSVIFHTKKNIFIPTLHRKPGHSVTEVKGLASFDNLRQLGPDSSPNVTSYSAPDVHSPPGHFYAFVCDHCFCKSDLRVSNHGPQKGAASYWWPAVKSLGYVTFSVLHGNSVGGRDRISLCRFTFSCLNCPVLVLSPISSSQSHFQESPVSLPHLGSTLFLGLPR